LAVYFFAFLILLAVIVLLLVESRLRAVRQLKSGGGRIGLGAKSVGIGGRIKPLRLLGFDIIKEWQ
jgi:hypothetical protein